MPDIQKMIDDLRSLSPRERRDLMAALGEPAPSQVPPRKPEASRDGKYQEMLLQAGLIRNVQIRHRNQQSFESYQPATICGEPISETIIKERR